MKKPIPPTQAQDENTSVNTSISSTGLGESSNRPTPYTIIEFDDNVESLWRNLRLAETSSTYTLETPDEFVAEEEEMEAINSMPEL